MNAKFLGRAAAMGLAGAALAVGCAQGVSDFNSSDVSTSTVATSGSGGGGGQGGGGGAGGQAFPCGVDCKGIVVPACSHAECNLTTHMCEVKQDMDGAPCEDGLFCTTQDTCMAGQCVGGPPNTCAMGMPAQCYVVTCDEASKTCTFGPGMDGSFCMPDDKCMMNAKCSGGQCIGQANECLFQPPPDDCHVMQCDPVDGQCKPHPGNDGLFCLDPNDKCTDNKICQNGVCIGGMPMDCSNLTQGCNIGVCDPNQGFCTTQAVPQGQNCPDATDACNQGKCDMNGNCVANPFKDGTACVVDACVLNQTCLAGKCQGGKDTTQVKFDETFDNNNAGWKTEGEWAIGPAKAANCPTFGPDPGKDHTGDMANGVGGVVIGGCENPVLHDFVYLTSPAVDVTGLNHVALSFYRWLNSDYEPFMQNTVDVYDGAAWQNIWASGGAPGIQDDVWKLQKFDITKYKNAKLQVRFGFKIGNAGVFTVSQWNVDDVVISGCP